MLDRRVNPNSKEIKKNSENELVHISYILRNSISKEQIKFEQHPNKSPAEITKKSTNLQNNKLKDVKPSLISFDIRVSGISPSHYFFSVADAIFRHKAPATRTKL